MYLCVSVAPVFQKSSLKTLRIPRKILHFKNLLLNKGNTKFHLFSESEYLFYVFLFCQINCLLSFSRYLKVIERNVCILLAGNSKSVQPVNKSTLLPYSSFLFPVKDTNGTA